MTRILVVDDEKSIRLTLKEFLSKEGYHVQVAEDVDRAIKILAGDVFDVVVTDIILPRISGVDLLNKIKEQSPDVEVIMMTGEPTIETASESLRLGAFDYLDKPIAKANLIKTVRNAFHRKKLKDEKKKLEEEKIRYQAELEKLLAEQTRLLKESEEHYRLAIESSNDGFVLSKDGKILSINQKLLEMFGYDNSDELTGKSILIFIHPDERERVLSIYEKRQAGMEVPSKYEFKGIRKNNDLIYIEISAHSTVHDGEAVNFAFLRNITLRKMALQSLKESEERFRVLFEYAPDAYCLNDHEGVIIDGNRAVEELIGYSKQEIIGKRFFELDCLSDDQAEKAADILIRDRKEMAPEPKELVLKHKDGKTLQVEMVAVPIKINSRDMVLSITRNITQRKKLEKQLQQAQKMEAIGTLAGGIAHDFNNILSSIIGFAELSMDDAKDDPILQDNLNEVFNAGNRAKELVKQILTFSRRRDEDVRPVRVGLILKEVVKMLRPSLPATIDIQHQVGTQDLISADPTQIHQVLMNLCTNAAHAMEENGGVLKLMLTEIAFEADTPTLSAGEYILLTVSDSGTGIPPAMIDSIFEPYFTTKPIGEGTGLGLSVVHGIVKSCRGDIVVNSEPGKGTTFEIYFPKLKKMPMPAGEIENLPTGKEKILFIDDELPIVKMGKKMLSGLGYDVETCSSASEAIRIFKQNPESHDLVITDMTMPDITGDRLAAELMKINKNIPVILCTGYSKKISAETLTDSCVKAVMMKPIVKKELAQTVRKILDGADR